MRRIYDRLISLANSFHNWLPLQGRAVCFFSILLFCPACSSVKVTPEAVRKITSRREEASTSMVRWDRALQLCNDFLNSPERITLPRGKLSLAENGMEFKNRDTVIPMPVSCTTWGDVVCRWYVAQERSEGFVVGFVTPKLNRVLDNTFFKQGNGKPRPPQNMAELILHELTHSYYRVGTVSFFKGLRYYAEAALLWRYRGHTMERLPRKTTAEFWKFYRRTSARKPSHGSTMVLKPFLATIQPPDPTVPAILILAKDRQDAVRQIQAKCSPGSSYTIVSDSLFGPAPAGVEASAPPGSNVSKQPPSPGHFR